jgi:hypothetical protein
VNSSPTTYLGLLWHSFVRMHGPLLGVTALAVGIIVWVFKPDERVSLAVTVPAFLTVLIMLVVAIDAGYDAWKLRTPGLPKVLYAKKWDQDGLEVVCLLEPSELFSYGLQVGFYYKNEDGFELLVGVGGVINIQDDRRVQVGMTSVVEGQEQAVRAICENTKNVIERVRVKPSIPHDVVSRIRREEKKA